MYNPIDTTDAISVTFILIYSVCFMSRKDHELDELYASISDDSKEQVIENEQSTDSGEWYNHLMIQDLHKMRLSECQLMTIAMACQSPPAIHQLLDSGLPTLLTCGVLGQYCSYFFISSFTLYIEFVVCFSW